MIQSKDMPPDSTIGTEDSSIPQEAATADLTRRIEAAEAGLEQIAPMPGLPNKRRVSCSRQFA